MSLLRQSVLTLLLLTSLSVQAERKASGSLSEATFRPLEKAQALMAEDRHEEALKLLQALQQRTANDYEQALVLQTLGFLHADRNQFARAIPYFEQALALNALPQQPHEQMLMALGQLLFSEGRLDEAIARLEAYFDEVGVAGSADAHLMLASAYADRQRYREALPHVSAAIAASDAPRLSWYQFKLGLHHALEQYAACAETLLNIIALAPDTAMPWQQLASVLIEIKRDREALAVLALADRRGLLTSATEVRNLAQLYRLLDIPYKAAEVLAAGIASGRLPGDESTRVALAEAWIAAREHGRADSVLAQAAEAASRGTLALRLAQVRIESRQWAAALEALDLALRKGVDSSGEVQFLRGVAAMSLDRLDMAEQAFTAAMDDPRRRADARAWRDHLRERRRMEAAG